MQEREDRHKEDGDAAGIDYRGRRRDRAIAA